MPKFSKLVLKFLQINHDQPSTSLQCRWCAWLKGQLPNRQWANHQCLRSCPKNWRRPAERSCIGCFGSARARTKKVQKTVAPKYCQSDLFTLFLGPYHYNDPLSHRCTSHHHPTSPSFRTLYGPQNWSPVCATAQSFIFSLVCLSGAQVSSNVLRLLIIKVVTFACIVRVYTGVLTCYCKS